jgi:hypothetical protein
MTRCHDSRDFAAFIGSVDCVNFIGWELELIPKRPQWTGISSDCDSLAESGCESQNFDFLLKIEGHFSDLNLPIPWRGA